MSQSPASTPVVCPIVPQAELDAAARAYEDITDPTDGPLTAFVLIARATRRAKETGDHTAYANAAHQALIDYGHMDPEK